MTKRCECCGQEVPLTEKEEDRENFLSDYGRDEKDVMEDEKGEYVMVEEENGTYGEEDYSINYRKKYLPEKLQAKYTPF
jgi:hypothetical protein